MPGPNWLKILGHLGKLHALAASLLANFLDYATRKTDTGTLPLFLFLVLITICFVAMIVALAMNFRLLGGRASSAPCSGLEIRNGCASSHLKFTNDTATPEYVMFQQPDQVGC